MATKLDFSRTVLEFDHKPWYPLARICRFKGGCAICGIRTFAFDDGQHDPRGPLGDHASSALQAAAFGMTGKDIPLCCNCANEQTRYEAALVLGKDYGWALP